MGIQGNFKKSEFGRSFTALDIASHTYVAIAVCCAGHVLPCAMPVISCHVLCQSWVVMCVASKLLLCGLPAIFPAHCSLSNLCRLAFKSSHDKTKQWSQKSWLEMGLFMMTFYGYIRADGKYVVDMYVDFTSNIHKCESDNLRYEDMAGQMGEKFTNLHHDKLRTIQHHFSEYIKYLQHLWDQPMPTGASTPSQKQFVSISPDGYPILLNDSYDIKKRELKYILWDYLG